MVATDPKQVFKVPLDSIILRPPDDGLPVVDDFITATVSFLFSGSRLIREPLDLNLETAVMPDGKTYEPVLSVKKGFTRLQLVLAEHMCFCCFGLASET